MARYCPECDARLPDDNNTGMLLFDPRLGKAVPSVQCQECHAKYPHTAVPHLGA